MVASARSLLGVALALVSGLAATRAEAQAVDESTGYIRMSDGIELRYTLWLPAGQTGPFPVIINYSGYSPGTAPDSSAHGALPGRLIPQGVALLGVNVRGTGCSSGYWDLFEPRWGQDGYEIVEWAAAQAWSSGRVGFYGISFPGITQLMVGPTRPPHLTAIAPQSLVRDVYRDVGFPGGIPNQNFAGLFVGIQEEPGAAEVPGAVIIDSDQECAANYTTREGTDGLSNVFLQQAQHPYDDSYVQRRRPGANVDTIQVPTLVFHQWQDEQTGPRFAGDFNLFNPATTWFVASNGDHSFGGCGRCSDLLEDFFMHYLLDENNGWQSTPHVQLWYDSTTSRQRVWSLDYSQWPPATTLDTYYLRAGGALSSSAPPLPTEASDTYAYPGVGSSTAYPFPQEAWEMSASLQTGYLAYETPPFTQDKVFFGPGSLDLWFSGTSTDLDFQITLTEIRPDGNEVFIQRGFLRASHRALDAARSTATRPYHTHQQADAQLLTPLQPVQSRIEIFPFSHAIRAGSRLRIWIEAPTTQTGYWGFRAVTDPSVVSIYHDSTRPSKLVLGVLPGRTAGAPLPTCGNQQNQPCRPDPL